MSGKGWIVVGLSMLFCWLGTNTGNGFKRRRILRDNKNGKGVKDERRIGITLIGGNPVIFDRNNVVGSPGKVEKSAEPTLESITGISRKVK
jgi:hypothetical protein